MENLTKYKTLAVEDYYVMSISDEDDGCRRLALVAEIDAPEDRRMCYVHLIVHHKTREPRRSEVRTDFYGVGQIIASLPYQRGNAEQQAAVIAVMQGVFDTYMDQGLQPAFMDVQSERAAMQCLRERQVSVADYAAPTDPEGYAKYQVWPELYLREQAVEQQKADLYARWDAERKQRNGESDEVVTHKRTTIWNG